MPPPPVTMSWEGVNEMVAVVVTALALFSRTMASPIIGEEVSIILPEATPVDATVSTSVRTVMPVVLPTVAAPNFSPLRVMTTAVLAAMLTTAVVMTMDVE